MPEVLLWLLVVYLVFRFFRMIERRNAARQNPSVRKPPAATPSTPYSDIEDAKFEDITPPGPPKPDDKQ